MARQESISERLFSYSFFVAENGGCLSLRFLFVFFPQLVFQVLNLGSQKSYGLVVDIVHFYVVFFAQFLELVPLSYTHHSHSLVVVDEGLFVEEAFGFCVESGNHAVSVVFVALVVVDALDSVCEYSSDFLEDW